MFAHLPATVDTTATIATNALLCGQTSNQPDLHTHHSHPFHLTSTIRTTPDPPVPVSRFLPPTQCPGKHASLSDSSHLISRFVGPGVPLSHHVLESMPFVVWLPGSSQVASSTPRSTRRMPENTVPSSADNKGWLAVSGQLTLPVLFSLYNF